MTAAPSRQRFDELASHPGLIPYAELEQFWSSLEPVDIDCHRGEGCGELTATMVYDAMPIHDHFKKVDDNAVVAITNGKGALDGGRYFFFYLERV